MQDGVRPAITQELLAKAFEERRHQGPSDALDIIIDLYRGSPAFTGLAERTQDDYRSWLDRISYRFGKVPARMVPQLRPEIIAWQDEMAGTPRAADRAVGMLSTLFKWARQRNLIAANPVQDIEPLYRANRADLIWELPHWFVVAPLPSHITRAIGLAGMTGLALSDFVDLQWSHVGDHAIEGARQKTGRSFIVPLYPALKAFLGDRGEGHVLRNSRGEPWTVSGFKSSWQKNKPPGFNRTLHDLRGTFATMLMVRGFSDQHVAMILGWAPERIAAIRARYVDRARVVREMAQAMGT